jgi:hypothetical protein
MKNTAAASGHIPDFEDEGRSGRAQPRWPIRFGSWRRFQVRRQRKSKIEYRKSLT